MLPFTPTQQDGDKGKVTDNKIKRHNFCILDVAKYTWTLLGRLAVSVGGARNFSSQGGDFEFHVGHRDDLILKILKKKKSDSANAVSFWGKKSSGETV